MNDLEKAILKTLAYFQIFSYPLTSTEIWKWLYRPSRAHSFREVKDCLLSSKILQSEIVRQEGFYCLNGSEHTVYLRKQNNNLAERKFYKACRLLRFFRFVPFIKMIAICNSLAYSNAREDSDIDIFIVSQKNKIWLARFWAVIIVRLLGRRPQEDNNKDTFCLSFFVTEDSLDVSSICLKNDVYMPYWMAQLMPIYDPGDYYQKFLDENLIETKPEYQYLQARFSAIEKAICRFLGVKELEKIRALYEKEMMQRILQAREHR